MPPQQAAAGQPSDVETGPRPADQSARYVAPFVVFLAFLALQSVLPLPLMADFLLRTAVLGGVLLFYSRPVIRLRPAFPLSTILLGAAVFIVWIGPDLLFPHYRQHWVFQNALTGAARTSMPTTALTEPWPLFLRVLRAAVITPIVEELFWRAWLMRWLISPRFSTVPLGAYSPSAFWLTAVLFASEHGPYWDVGLAAGILYNWWMIRTKSLADCILAHAVTNGLLCAWVIATHNWQYWL